LYFLALLFIEILKKIKKILIIIQRSNGDVFLSQSLISSIFKHYQSPQIDLLVNDDTLQIAKLMQFINYIHTFSYKKKHEAQWSQEKTLVKSIYRKYDLSINLTSSDRSVIYSLLASRKSITAIEENIKKSWWKKILPNDYYFFDSNKHILLNNLEPLNLLKIPHENIQQCPPLNKESITNIKKKLFDKGVGEFIIFHPSAQYKYKIYPQKLRDALLAKLSSIGISILVTGSNNKIDSSIKNSLPSLPNIFDLIGDTSLEEYFALSHLSLAYIGMDTLNMHIAASQNKRIFAIFGPTNVNMWSPWSNMTFSSAQKDAPVQNYGNVTLFQAHLPCVACGKAGCKDLHLQSDCLDEIIPESIFNEFNNWFSNKNQKVEALKKISLEQQNRKIILYIVYGNDEGYYDGAKYSFLTLLNWVEDEDPIEIVVLTEKPEKFENFPVTTFAIDSNQKKEWSLSGAYDFRIKNRGLFYIMNKMKLNSHDKILFFDTDTYFHKSPLPLFELIKFDQAVFYLNEGLIYNRKRFNVYSENLKDKKIDYGGQFYELNQNSEIWGSLMIGIMPNMISSLEWADKLMVKFFEIVPSHTIESFSLSEVLLKKYKIVEGKRYVSLYSTRRKKEHAVKILSSFFTTNESLPIEDQISLAQKVKIKRPIFTVIKQRFAKVKDVWQ
jgi:heptosyltransferase III